MTGALALGVTFAALGLFAWVGWRAGRAAVLDRDGFLAARGSQPALPLSLSFFASGLGAWILFAPPEVGTFAGIVGVVGYGLGAAAPFLLFAWVGPKLRERLPAGVTLTHFVRLRFGRPMQAYVALISVFYMFIFVTAELTAIGGVLALVSGVNPLVPILAVAGVTAAYTAYGGLPASLQTDRWQAWMVLALVALGLAAILTGVPDPVGRAQAAGLSRLTGVGFESLVVLVIAVAAANFFHQGYWQRVWAARDRRSLATGAVGAALLSLPVVVLLGLFGMVAAGAEGTGNPSLAFFGLLEGLPAWVLALVVALGVALVASSVDTLQNALVALVAEDVAGGRLGLTGARWLTVVLTLPAVAIAVQGLSVLRLLLVADLLAAATILPVLLGLWQRASRWAALAGGLAGLAGVVVLGWVTRGSLGAGLHLLTLPSTEAGGLDLGAFVVAPLVSGLVTWLASLALPAEQVPRPVARAP
ncbi:MAG: sodium:solute symporter [Actinomycetota bacterium]|nr:sodium:solute symporter [Actinomycetota bacterium]